MLIFVGQMWLGALDLELSQIVATVDPTKNWGIFTCACQGGHKVSFKCADGTLCRIAAMHIRGDQLVT